MLNANGVRVQDSSSSVITCFARFLQGILLVLSAPGRLVVILSDYSKSTCGVSVYISFYKYEYSILSFFFVVLRVLLAVTIVRELGSVPSGWKSLQCHCS